MSTGETSPLNANYKHILAKRKGARAHWTERPLQDYKLVIQTWVNRNLFQVERYPVTLRLKVGDSHIHALSQ